MYGFLIQTLVDYIKAKYGQETWNKVKENLGLAVVGGSNERRTRMFN